MAKHSAGILLYRRTGIGLEVFLIHPGGPFFAKKDDGVWSIPKGEFEPNEDPLDAARREFKEETGEVLDGDAIELTPVKLKSGKIVHAWAIGGNINAQTIKSNVFEMEWPPRSGKKQSFPEVDRAGWFSLNIARQKVNAAQIALIDELEKIATK